MLCDPPDPPSVAVLVLNWNGEDDTVEAVESLRRMDYARFDVLVLDNGSRPESVNEIRRRCPGVEIVENNANLGYAGGNNVGLRLALERRATYCFVVNNDVVVDPPTLTRLVEAAEADPSIAVIGPRVYRYEEPEALFYPGWRIDWRRWLFHRGPPNDDHAKTGRGDRLSSSDGQETSDAAGIADVDYVQGCAMLIRSEFLRREGLFDERFHLYCDDADLCVRAQRARWRTVEMATARARHKGYGSSGKDSPLKTYYSLRNRLLFISKHAPRRNRPLLRAQLIGLDTGRQAATALRRMAGGGFRRGWDTLCALGRALLDWARGRYGPGPQWLFRK